MVMAKKQIRTMEKRSIKDPELKLLIEECKILREKISANVVEISKNAAILNVSLPQNNEAVIKNEKSRNMQN